MAVIQSAPESDFQNADQAASSVRSAHFESLQQQQPNQAANQQQLASIANIESALLDPPRGLFQQPPPPQAPRRSRQQQSPMQNYQNMLSSASVNHGINHGFMSSFLQGEKEKMTAAAMQISKQFAGSLPPPATRPAVLDTADSVTAQQSSPASTGGSSSNTTLTAPSNANQLSQQHQQFTNAQKQQVAHYGQQQQQQGRQGPGGLMPMMMMPLSMMPDNMIGQAYNAATQQALSVESGTFKSTHKTTTSGFDSALKELDVPSKQHLPSLACSDIELILPAQLSGREKFLLSKDTNRQATFAHLLIAMNNPNLTRTLFPLF